LVALETTFSDSDSSMDVAITELTNQMLTLSQPVLQAVIHKFQENVTGVQWSWPFLRAKIWLLLHQDLTKGALSAFILCVP